MQPNPGGPSGEAQLRGEVFFGLGHLVLGGHCAALQGMQVIADAGVELGERSEREAAHPCVEPGRELIERNGEFRPKAFLRRRADIVGCILGDERVCHGAQLADVGDRRVLAVELEAGMTALLEAEGFRDVQQNLRIRASMVGSTEGSTYVVEAPRSAATTARKSAASVPGNNGIAPTPSAVGRSSAGAATGFGFTSWTNMDWPLIVGGKPMLSIPAFVPIAFELTVLFGALATVIGLFDEDPKPGV